jgi:crotonobetainyl-CoA:carnitine CoA-transferase CaiB-like acyl-CoA transferase
MSRLRTSNAKHSSLNSAQPTAHGVGVVLAKVRTTEEFLKEPQYTEVLSAMPLITVEKIGDSEPMPLKNDGLTPLDGVRAFGMGHVIAGGAMGRDLAMYGADVLNIWRPNATEVEAFAWDVQVGMRSIILDNSKEDRATFDKPADGCRRLLRQQAPRILRAKRSDRRRTVREEAGTDPCQGRPPWRIRAVVEPSRLR